MAAHVVDVLVVGGGGSGLSAAIAAATAGARVVLLEKNHHVGGTTGLSVGSITAAGTRWQKAKGIVDTPDEHFADMSRFLGPLDSRENMALRRVLVDNVPQTLEWLRSIGLRFYGPQPEPPHQKPRMHNVLPNSRAYPYYLLREARKRGVEVRVDARVTRLVREGNRVVGVQAVEGGTPVDYRVKGGVVLASGDFSSGRDLKSRFKPEVADIDAINPSSTGDGQSMAALEGASIVNGDIIWGPSLRFKAPARDTFLRRLPPSRVLTGLMKFALDVFPVWMFRPFIMSFMTSSLSPEPTIFAAGAILVNQEGQRFTDECKAPAFDIPKQSAKQAYLVFDQTVAEQFERWPDFISTAPGLAYAYLSDYRRTRSDLYFVAETIDELAVKMRLPPLSLAATVREYNAGLPGAQGKRKPIATGPFHALGPVQSWVVLTEGGLAVDETHRVLDAGGVPIPGLWAAGSVGQGGVLLAGHGHHIGWAMTSGRRAGRFAAEASGNPGVDAGTVTVDPSNASNLRFQVANQQFANDGRPAS